MPEAMKEDIAPEITIRSVIHGKTHVASLTRVRNNRDGSSTGIESDTCRIG